MSNAATYVEPATYTTPFPYAVAFGAFNDAPVPIPALVDDDPSPAAVVTMPNTSEGEAAAGTAGTATNMPDTTLSSAAAVTGLTARTGPGMTANCDHDGAVPA